MQIEFTWSDVKQQVARENLRQDVNQMVEITINALTSYSTVKWKNQLEHVQRYFFEFGYYLFKLSLYAICLYFNRLGKKYWEEVYIVYI